MTNNELRNKIDTILRSPASCSPDEFHRIANIYGERVTAINLRVSTCNQWLDTGLLSEAVHMASIKPDLLRELGVLDLGETLEDWDSLCESNEATVAPKANWELATYINEAYETEENLKPLLRDVRLAMLRHTSVRDRVSLLRELLEENPENPIWESMVMEHERILLDDIKEDLDDAIENEDLDKISFLKSELFSAQWVEHPPSELLDMVKEAKKQTKSFHVVIQFRATAKSMFKAMSEQNEKKARRLGEKWKTAVACGLHPPDDAAETASIIFAWLDELSSEEQKNTEYRHACENLVRALDESASVDELEVLYSKIVCIGHGVDPLLESRYRGRVTGHKSSQKNKLVIKTIVTIVAICALAATALMINRWNASNNALASYQNNLTNAVDQIPPDIELIKKLLISGDSLFQEEMSFSLAPIVNSANTIIDEDKKRQNGFETLLAVAGSKSPLQVSKPDLDMLRDLARGDKEKQQVTDLSTRVNNAQTDADAKIIATIRGKVENIQNKCDGIKDHLQNNPGKGELESFRSQLNTLDDSVREILQLQDNLYGRHTTISNLIRGLRSTIQGMRSRVDSGLDTIGKAGEIENRLLASTSTDDFLEQIQILKNFNQYQFEDDIHKVCVSLNLIKTIPVWSALREQIPRDLNSLYASTYKVDSLCRGLEKLVNQPMPGKRDVVAFFDFINSVLQMREQNNSPEFRIQTFLYTQENDGLTPWNKTNLRRVVTQQGNFFGTNLSVKRKNSDQFWIQGCYLTSKDIVFGDTEKKIVSIKDDPNIGDARVESTGLQQWLNRVQSGELLKSPPVSKPYLWYLNLLEYIANIEKMEPFVRRALTARLAKAHEDSSWYKIESLAEIAKFHANDPPSGWPDPGGLRDERNGLADTLSNYDVDAVHKMQADCENAFNNIVIPPSYMYAGVVWPDSSSKKALHISNSAIRLTPYNTDLFYLVGTDDTCSWRQFGTIKAVEVTTVDLQNVPVGTPVFIKNK
jgi:hypothetical protein